MMQQSRQAIKEFLYLLIIGSILFYAILKIDEGFLALTDPIAWLYQISGWASILALFASFILPYPSSKWMGYFCFIAATLHVMIFVNLDFNFLWDTILEEIKQKHYLYYGMAAWVILCFAMILSLKQLFWKFKLVWFIYTAFLLVEVHIVLIQKVMTPLYIFCIVTGTLLIFFNILERIKRH